MQYMMDPNFMMFVQNMNPTGKIKINNLDFNQFMMQGGMDPSQFNLNEMNPYGNQNMGYMPQEGDSNQNYGYMGMNMGMNMGNPNQQN